MKKFGFLLLVLALVLCCVSCSANATNAENTANAGYTKAGELKTQVINGYLK